MSIRTIFFIFMSCSEGFDGIGETHHSTGRMEQYGNNQPVDMSISNEAVHSDAVMSLSSVQPGVCVSGSKDKVGSIMIFLLKLSPRQNVQNIFTSAIS